MPSHSSPTTFATLPSLDVDRRQLVLQQRSRSRLRSARPLSAFFECRNQLDVLGVVRKHIAHPLPLSGHPAHLAIVKLAPHVASLQKRRDRLCCIGSVRTQLAVLRPATLPPIVGTVCTSTCSRKALSAFRKSASETNVTSVLPNPGAEATTLRRRRLHRHTADYTAPSQSACRHERIPPSGICTLMVLSGLVPVTRIVTSLAIVPVLPNGEHTSPVALARGIPRNQSPCRSGNRDGVR